MFTRSWYQSEVPFGHIGNGDNICLEILDEQIVGVYLNGMLQTPDVDYRNYLGEFVLFLSCGIESLGLTRVGLFLRKEDFLAIKKSCKEEDLAEYLLHSDKNVREFSKQRLEQLSEVVQTQYTAGSSKSISRK